MVCRRMRKKEDETEKFRYRYELKFLCTQLQIEMLCAQLDCLMEKDAHSGADGLYTVRSLYFDDFENLEDSEYYECLEHWVYLAES